MREKGSLGPSAQKAPSQLHLSHRECAPHHRLAPQKSQCNKKPEKDRKTQVGGMVGLGSLQASQPPARQGRQREPSDESLIKEWK